MAFHRSSSSPYNKIVSPSGGILFPPCDGSKAAFAFCFSGCDVVAWNDKEDDDDGDAALICIDPSCSNCDCKCNAETGSLKNQQRLC